MIAPTMGPISAFSDGQLGPLWGTFLDLPCNGAESTTNPKAKTNAKTADGRNSPIAYRYRLTDKPSVWLTLFAPGTDLREARRVLLRQFGSRLIEVHPNKRKSR